METIVSGSKHRSQAVIVSHDSLDGFGALWVASKAYGKKADYVLRRYDSIQRNHPKKLDTYFLGFSEPRETMAMRQDWLSTTGKHFMAVDCEPDLKPELDSVPFGKFFGGKCRSELALEFLSKHRGANIDKPWIVDYLVDWHHGAFSKPGSREIRALLSCTPSSFASWDTVELLGAQEAAEQGASKLETMELMIDKQARYSTSITIDGESIYACNATVLEQETGEAIMDKHKASVSATWKDTSETERLYRLWGDCGKMALSMGGIGNEFRVPRSGEGMGKINFVEVLAARIRCHYLRADVDAAALKVAVDDIVRDSFEKMQEVSKPVSADDYCSRLPFLSSKSRDFVDANYADCTIAEVLRDIARNEVKFNKGHAREIVSSAALCRIKGCDSWNGSSSYS